MANAVHKLTLILKSDIIYKIVMRKHLRKKTLRIVIQKLKFLFSRQNIIRISNYMIIMIP